MAITIMGTPTLAEVASATSLTVNVPAGAAVGEILLAGFVTSSNSSSQFPPAGFTLIEAKLTGVNSVKIGYRVVDGTESASYVFSAAATASADRLSGFMLRLAGVDMTNKFDITPGTAGMDGAATSFNDVSMTWPSITTATDNATIFTLMGLGSASTNSLTAPAQDTMVLQSTDVGRDMFLSKELRATAGAIGTRTWTKTVTSGTQWFGGVRVAFRAAGVATAPTVNAGADASVNVNSAFSRTATESANGGAISARSWTINSGPAGVGSTIGTAAALSWTPTVVGNYVLRYSATNSAGTSTDDVAVTVIGLPIVDAGADATGTTGVTFSRTGTAGANFGTITSSQWTIFSGPSGAGSVIGSANALSWTPSVAGTYVLRFSATNQAGTSTDDVTVTVAQGTGAIQVERRQHIGSGAMLATNTLTSATTGTLGSPALAGSALIGIWTVDGASGTFTAPAGWTVLANAPGTNDVSILVCGKVAVGGETNATASWSTASYGVATVLAEYINVSDDPFGPVFSTTYSSVSRTSLSLGPLTSDAEGLAIALFGCDSVVASTGVTYGFQMAAPGYENVIVAYQSGVNGAPGATLVQATSPITAGTTVPATTFTSDRSDQITGAMVLLRVAGSEGSVLPPVLNHRVNGIAVGGVGRVAVSVNNTESVRLVVATDEAISQSVQYGPAVTPDARGAAQLTCPGLNPGTRYYYRVAMTDGANNETWDNGAVGTFKTPPVGAANFAFTFGSCCNASDSNAMAAMAARKDDLGLHLGDMYYADGSGTGIDNIRAKYNSRLNAPNHHAWMSTTAFAYTTSDHEGMNNGTTAGSDPTAWTNVNAVYRELIPTPPLPGGATGFYYSFTWGRVRFIVMDTRSFATNALTADSSTKTRLGSTQKQWLKDTITNSSEAAIVLVQADPWLGAVVAGDDKWWGYDTERQELASFFAASGKHLIMLAGDMHALAADSGANSPGGIPLLHASPFSNTSSIKGGPYSSGTYPTASGSSVAQYGRVVVTDTGDSLSMAFTGYSSDNTVRLTQTTTFTTSAATPGGWVVEKWDGTKLVRQTLTK